MNSLRASRRKKVDAGWVICPECGFQRKREWLKQPCVVCDTMYYEPEPRKATEPKTRQVTLDRAKRATLSAFLSALKGGE